MTQKVAILDHDTNVFFAYSKGNLYQADMSSLKAATPAPLEWGATNAPNFDATGYAPVMGLAQNHIHFLNRNAEGQADIFVIHFAYWQPEVQFYAPGNNAGTFPQKHGQAASFFTGDNQAQKRFAFLPDDNSKTYVIDVEKNTTTVLPGPPASAGFASNPAGLMGRLCASPSALVYMSPANELHYIGVDQNNMAAAGNPWAPISSSELVAAAAVDPVTTSAPATGAASATSSGMVSVRTSGTSTGTASASNPSSTTSANGAMSLNVGLGAGVVAMLVGIQALLMF
ncbi:hypothetical protein FRC07_008810 [Ceratobasidium sp. 392]|nr:hypothetical protein FRC07_008810 [Ceratobasidium sp. 392]